MQGITAKLGRSDIDIQHPLQGLLCASVTTAPHSQECHDRYCELGQGCCRFLDQVTMEIAETGLYLCDDH